jgi:hypothetical protein
MSTTTAGALEAALAYASAGFAVLPLDGKKARIKDWPARASTDVAVVAEWWRRWPDANVGIRTGSESGLLVLDVDPRHGGTSTLEALTRKYGRLPKTAKSLTGTGGFHYAFKHPGREVRNSVGALGPGLDLRADGGYVAVPPSLHPESGKPYKWLVPLQELAEAPRWLFEVRQATNGNGAQIGDVIPEGERDKTLASLAGTMRRRGMGEAEIFAALTVTNQRCKPPHSQTDLARIAKSVSRYPPEQGQEQEHAASPARTLTYRRLADVEMKSIEWLDKPLFQRAAFHLVAGKKGAGKGTYLAYLASRVTQGQLFDQPMNAVFMSSEDSDAIDIKPRAIAAGADVNRIISITERMLLPRDIEALKQTALEVGDVGMLVIDPIGNHLGGADTDAEGRVRDAIAPLNELADELDCLLIAVRHLKKDTQGGALASVLGSTAWVDVPRSVLAMAADDEEEMLFHIEVVAGNRGPSGQGRSFRIELADVGLKEPVTKAVELGVSKKSVETLLGANQQSKSGKARTLILELLESVPEMESDQLDARVAQETGLVVGTVKNQRTKLKEQGLIKIRPEKDEHGKVLAWHVARTNASID